MKLSQSGPSVALYHPTRRLIAQRTLGKAKAADAQVAASTAKLAMTLNSSSNAENDKKRERDMSRFNKTRGEHLRWVVLCNDMLLWATEPPEMRYKGMVIMTVCCIHMTLPCVFIITVHLCILSSILTPTTSVDPPQATSSSHTPPSRA